MYPTSRSMRHAGSGGYGLARQIHRRGCPGNLNCMQRSECYLTNGSIRTLQRVQVLLYRTVTSCEPCCIFTYDPLDRVINVFHLTVPFWPRLACDIFFMRYTQGWSRFDQPVPILDMREDTLDSCRLAGEPLTEWYHKVKSTRQAEHALETCIDPRRMIQLVHDVRAEHLIKRHVKGCFERGCRVRRFLPVEKMRGNGDTMRRCRSRRIRISFRRKIVLDVQSEVVQRGRVKVGRDDFRIAPVAFATVRHSPQDTANDREAYQPRARAKLQHTNRRRRRSK